MTHQPHPCEDATVKPVAGGDEQIDRLLDTVVPGGSQARDWFLPHDTEKGLANVRTVVRLMLARAAVPVEAVVAATDLHQHVEGFLCKAWGESDLPAAALCRDMAGVRQFLIDEWLGDEDSPDWEGKPILPGVMDELATYNWADEGNEWSTRFEIGGLSIERVTFQAAAELVSAIPAVPQGSQLVPVVPTKDMLAAGGREWAVAPASVPGIELCHTIYRAMLAAAPPAVPLQGQAQGVEARQPTLSPEMRASLRHFLSAALIFPTDRPLGQTDTKDRVYQRTLAAFDEWFALSDRAAPTPKQEPAK